MTAKPEMPSGKPTRRSLLQEAAVMAAPPVTVTADELVADAEELLLARADVNDLRARGYDVTDAMFDRLELLAAMVTPIEVLEQQRDQARTILLTIRERIALIGDAAGLPPALFALEITSRTQLSAIMRKMEAFLVNVAQHYEQLPDKKRIDGMVSDARRLIATHTRSLNETKQRRGEPASSATTARQLEALLLQTLRSLSRQGLSAYRHDPVRSAAYRLDRLTARRASKVSPPISATDDAL